MSPQMLLKTLNVPLAVKHSWQLVLKRPSIEFILTVLNGPVKHCSWNWKRYIQKVEHTLWSNYV